MLILIYKILKYNKQNARKNDTLHRTRITKKLLLYFHLFLHKDKIDFIIHNNYIKTILMIQVRLLSFFPYY